MLALLICVLVQAAACLSATFTPAPVPGDIIISYPTTNIVTHRPVTLAVGGGALSVPHDYYGLEYKFNISYTSPDGNHWVDIGDSRSFGALCSGRQANEIPEGKLNSVSFSADLPGTYTAFWAITYATSSNATVNETHCDLPTAQESSQTWLYNATFTAVDSASSTSPSAVHTTATIALAPTPTGQFFEKTSEKNGASLFASSLGLSSLCALSLALLAV